MTVKKVIQASVRDISERKLAEEELRESKEQTETILHNVQCGVLVIDAETHEIIHANPLALSLSGCTLDEMIGRICHEFICPNSLGNCPITDHGKTIDEAECVLVKMDKGELEILKTVTPITLGDRKCLLESFIDISDRKKGGSTASVKRRTINRSTANCQYRKLVA